MNTSPAMVTCVDSRTVKMNCWQLLLWSEQEKWKRLLKYPSPCVNVNGKTGRVTSVKVCEGLEKVAITHVLCRELT